MYSRACHSLPRLHLWLLTFPHTHTRARIQVSGSQLTDLDQVSGQAMPNLMINSAQIVDLADAIKNSTNGTSGGSSGGGGSVDGSSITGTISSATIAGSQITGSISSATIDGGSVTGTIDGSKVSGQLDVNTLLGIFSWELITVCRETTCKRGLADHTGMCSV